MDVAGRSGRGLDRSTAYPLLRSDWLDWTACILGLALAATFGAAVASLAMTQTVFGIDMSPVFAAVLEWVR